MPHWRSRDRDAADPLASLPPEAGRVLCDLARRAIVGHLDPKSRPEPETAPPDWLSRDGATFVTLTSDGDLRGCLGSLSARRPLGEDVVANAVAAATRDPRFAPVRLEELPRLDIEVSVLSAAEPIDANGEAAMVAALRPGTDGVILSYRRQRGTFLPQVWDKVPDPADFLRQLKRKAGLRPDFWSDEIRLERYAVAEFHEGGSG